jgi:hypothetical protein
MSILSLAPAASTVGCLASIATAGSFCLFCENGDVGLPTVTRVSGLSANAGPAGNTTTAATAAMDSAQTDFRMPPPHPDGSGIEEEPDPGVPSETLLTRRVSVN